MNETVRLILSLSISGSIIAGLIFLIKPLIKYKLSKSIQYYIWIVVLLRLILPFSFDNSIMNSFFYREHSAIITTIQSKENVSNEASFPMIKENISNPIQNIEESNSRYLSTFKQLIIYIWLFGVIISLTVNIKGYARFLKHLKLTNKPATDTENHILGSILNGRNNVRLLRNRYVSTPMLVGIYRSCIIIPDSDFDEEQLKYILLHEITHLRHFDIVVKWLTMIAVSVHWFNPFVYFIKKELNHTCELACDEIVIKKLSIAEKQIYGDTLISVAAKNKYPMGVLQVTMSEEKETLKERLVAIMKYNKKSKFAIFMSIVILCAIISGAVLLGACSSNFKILNQDAKIDEINPKHLLVFIMNYDDATKILVFDEIEWIAQTDIKRINELGLNAEDDFPNGFHIYNGIEEKKSLKVSDAVKVYLVDLSSSPEKPLLTDINELTKHIVEYPAPFILTIEDNVIIEISEQYTP